LPSLHSTELPREAADRGKHDNENRAESIANHRRLEAKIAAGMPLLPSCARFIAAKAAPTRLCPIYRG
jgi:hypothetical protein